MGIAILILPLALVVGGLVYILNIENKKMNEEQMTNIASQGDTPEERHNPAFHLFLYLVSFLSLGFLVTGILISFFQTINKFIPDSLHDKSYSYFDNDAMKFGLSAMIVTIPLYYGILWLLNRKLKNKEVPADSLVRKIITYLAMVVFSAMTIGSLVTLVYNYFDGELTARFVLKTLIFFTVSLFFFGFYFWEIRRTEFVQKTFHQLFTVSLILALFSMILGFFVIDSPATARARQIDNKLIDDMQSAARRINRNFKGEFKGRDEFDFSNVTNIRQREQIALEMAKNGESAEVIQKFLDNLGEEERERKLPAVEKIQKLIGEDIIYKPGEGSIYQLCGDFKREDEGSGDRWDLHRKKWAHSAGMHCFTFDAELLDGYDTYPVQIKAD